MYPLIFDFLIKIFMYFNFNLFYLYFMLIVFICLFVSVFFFFYYFFFYFVKQILHLFKIKLVSNILYKQAV